MGGRCDLRPIIVAGGEIAGQFERDPRIASTDLRDARFGKKQVAFDQPFGNVNQHGRGLKTLDFGLKLDQVRLCPFLTQALQRDRRSGFCFPTTRFGLQHDGPRRFDHIQDKKTFDLVPVDGRPEDLVAFWNMCGIWT